MKKLLMLVVAASLTGSMLAGGLVTNTNQSALFTRLQSRNASLSLDAAYYNPAGLTSLGQGLFVSVNNQTIGQTRTITSTYPYLSGSPREFDGTVSAPLFPSVYVGYNLGRFAFSAGLTPIGGGGGAKYADGLPSFEMMIADVVPILQSQLQPLDAAILGGTGTDPFFRNIAGYSSSIFFEGSSVYFGYQVNAAYKVNDIISIAVGGRMVTAKNTYNGYITDVTIDAPQAYGGTQTPGNYLRTVAAVPGVPAGTAAVLNGTATYLDGATEVEVDAEQTGSGFTPVFSINFALAENLNVAFKYEGKTKLELITKLNDNKGGGIFFEGDTAIADMPGMFGAGFEYKPFDNLLLTGSMNVFFDGNVDYDGSRSLNINMIEKNSKEIGFGAQYTINEKMRASAGWLGTFTGVNSNYINDQRYSANTHTIGGGIGYRINPMIDINLAAAYTIYDLATKEYNHFLAGVIPVPVSQTYDKRLWLIAVGVDFTFGK